MSSLRRRPPFLAVPLGLAARAGLLVVPLALTLIAALAAPAVAALPSTSTPVLSLDRTIRTSPFQATSVSAKDGEGMAYVARDRSLWLVGDNGRSAYEVDPFSGALKRVVGPTEFEAAPQLGGTAQAGSNRDGDLESLAYDEATDTLYAFSGSCCTSAALPTAFRLTRDGSGRLNIDSFQPLGSGSDFTGAAWNPSDGQLYVAKSSAIRRYDYASNSVGPQLGVGVSGILGMDFTTAGDLILVTSAERLYRVDWGSKTMVAGWNLDLTGFGIRDSRAVEAIPDPSAPSVDQLYVFDGYDGRSSGDPLRYAVFVFDVGSGSGGEGGGDGGGGGSGTGTGTELVGNTGFETDTSGWAGAGVAALDRTSVAHTGSAGAVVTNGTSSSGTCILNDRPDWASSTGAGTYTASLWVRAETAGAKLRLRLREYASRSLVRSAATTMLLGTGWQRVTVSLATQSGHTLDMSALVPNAPPGVCFEGDDASLTLGGALRSPRGVAEERTRPTTASR